VDDIIVYSKTYEEHVRRLDAVIGKLTTAGFTINIDTCEFCKQEIKCFGHVTSLSTAEVCDRNGKIKGQFKWKSIKVYMEETDEI
jgi:hypothetical protein